jgi:hypothetical protein
VKKKWKKNGEKKWKKSEKKVKKFRLLDKIASTNSMLKNLVQKTIGGVKIKSRALHNRACTRVRTRGTPIGTFQFFVLAATVRRVRWNSPSIPPFKDTNFPTPLYIINKAIYTRARGRAYARPGYWEPLFCCKIKWKWFDFIENKNDGKRPWLLL